MLLRSKKQKEITKSKQGDFKNKVYGSKSKRLKEMGDRYQGVDSTIGRGKTTNKDKGDLNNQGRDIVRTQKGRYLTNKYQGNRNRVREGKSCEDLKRIGKGIVKKELKKDAHYRKYKTEIKEDKGRREGSKTIQITQEKEVKTERNNPLVIIKPEEEEDSSDSLRMFIEVGVHKINALIDTGAQLSIVASKLLEELEAEGLTFKKLPINATGVKGAFGDSTKMVRAMVQIPFRVASKDVTHQFLVVKELAENLVIGIDFLKEQDAIINVKDGGVVLKDTPIPEENPMKVYKKQKLEKQKDDKIDKISQTTDLVAQQMKDVMGNYDKILKKEIRHLKSIHQIFMRDKKPIYLIPNAYKQQVLEEISSLQDSAEYGANQNTAESRDIRKIMQQMIHQYHEIRLAHYKELWQKYEGEMENLFTKFEKLQEELEEKLHKIVRVVIGEIEENKRDVNKAENIELIEEKVTDVNMNNKVEVASKKKAEMNNKKKAKPRIIDTKIIKEKIKIVKRRDPKLYMKLIVRLENLTDEQIARESENNRSKPARKQTKFFGENSNEADDAFMADRPKFVDKNIITKIKRRNTYYKKILEEGITPRRMNPKCRAIPSRKCKDTRRSEGGIPTSSIYSNDSSD